MALRSIIIRVGAVVIAATVSAQDSLLTSTPIDKARLSEHVKVLSADAFEGRAPASTAEPKVIDYIVSQMVAAGLSPAGDIDARGGRAWTQDVQLAQADVDGVVTATLSTGDTRKVVRQGDDIAVRATHLKVDQVSIREAPLVFIGYGITAPERRWDDFKGFDLRGKVGLVLINDPDFETDLADRFDGKAMTYYGRWTYKFEEAARRGALGVIVIHETAPASYGWATVKNSNTATMFDIVRDDPATVHPLLEAWLQRDIVVDLFRSQGLDFEAEKKKAQTPAFKPVPLGNATVSVDYAVKHTQVVSRNVAGQLRGTQRPGEVVIYSAHWDHLGIGLPDERGDRIFNGARDNALGVGSLLELARVFGGAPPPQRTVLFLAPTAEEKGLLGSEYYAEHPLYPLATTVALYNMDTGSTWGLANDLAVAGDGKVSLTNDLAAAARRQGREFSPDPRPEAGSFYRSDHFPFAKVGVPAISFRAGLNLVNGGPAAGRSASDDYTEKRYHQPGDEWNPDWDLTGAAVDTGLLYTLGRDMANSRRWPEWEAGSEFKARRDSSRTARR